MRIGGCAAVTACESCIFLDKYFNIKLYPYDVNNITKSDYIKFSGIMKPYLRPRITGINKLNTYIDGFSAYLKDQDSTVTLNSVDGSADYNAAKSKLKAQLDKGIPVPYLNLYHKDKTFKDYEWHWFMINGYEELENAFMVKAVNYSSGQWLDFDSLWHTGYEKKGGFIIINI